MAAWVKAGTREEVGKIQIISYDFHPYASNRNSYGSHRSSVGSVLSFRVSELLIAHGINIVLRKSFAI